jgi:ubiquinone/menaquinone biosynthesis C-methylase UbiE
MDDNSNPCLDGAGTSGEVRVWSEDPLTARARAIWSAVDFHPIARAFAVGAAEFIARLNLRHGQQLLDVACGTGNLAIPAAVAGASVTGVDIAPNLIAIARREARAAGVDACFDIGDAELLPYPDQRFDTTVTMFGAMFAYRPMRAAAEMLRVTTRGGRIAMANWTPEGFIGSLLRAHVAVVPPPEGVPSPLAWGQEETVRQRFGQGVTALAMTRRTLELRFDVPPEGVTEIFAANYGPTVATLKKATPEGASQLRQELTRLFREYNLATDGTTVVAGEYLDVQARVA